MRSPADAFPMTDLGEVSEGDIVDAPLAVRRVDAPTAYDGGHLVRLELGNATGVLPAKLWLGPDEDRAREVAASIEPGDVLAVAAPVRTYRDRLELNLEAVPAEAEDWEPGELLPSTDAHVGRRLHRCLRAARSIADEQVRRVVLHVWTDEATRAAIARAPATKRRHRAHLGGWIEHVHAELALAETLADLHPELDRDLLVAGVLLHDLGRLDAYEAETTIDLTREGRLLGTAALADERLQRALTVCAIDRDRALHLRHVALAHAGRADWGAAVEPVTPEAIAVHAIERLDTRLARVLEVAGERRQRGKTSGYSSKLGRFLELADPLDDGATERSAAADVEAPSSAPA
jgi:3'-5' exoribonuclease